MSIQLHHAVEDGNWHQAHFLLENGVNPNATINDVSKTPLHRACQNTDWPMIDLLNTYGARWNVREKGGYQPMNIVYSLGKGEACLLDDYDRWMNQAKALAHALDFSSSATVDGTLIPLERSLSHGMLPHLAAIFDDIRQAENDMNKASLQKIEEALRYSFNGMHSKKPLLRKIKSGELVFLTAGWEGHGVGICFYGGYMAICNLGEKSDEFGTMVVFAINTNKMNEEILDRIQEVNADFSADAGAKVLYEEIPRNLEGVLRSDLQLDLESQEANTCTFASQKAAALFAYQMLNIERSDQKELKAELKLLPKLIKQMGRTRYWIHGLQENPAFEISPKNRRYLDGQFTEKTTSSIWKRFKKGISKFFY